MPCAWGLTLGAWGLVLAAKGLGLWPLPGLESTLLPCLDRVHCSRWLGRYCNVSSRPRLSQASPHVLLMVGRLASRQAIRVPGGCNISVEGVKGGRLLLLASKQ